MPTVHIIANPVAGGGRGALMAQALLAAIEARGVPVTTFATARAGDARDAAAGAVADVVAVIGGDGTLNEVLNGLPEGSPARIAILPVGTANVVARELGMRSDATSVAKAILDGHAVAMDIGLHGARRFLLGAGAGIDAAVTKVVQEGRGKKSNLLHWVWPAFKTVMRYTFPPIAVTVDGERVAEGAQYVIIGNCRNSAGIFPATPRARVGDGLLDVCAISGISKARIAWLLANVWRPDFIDRPWIDYRQGKVIELQPADSEATVYLQIDGDPAGQIPARFEVADWPVHMVVPEPRTE